MGLISKIGDRIFGSDENLESLDRRLFLRGLAVSSAGLVIGRQAIILPATPRFTSMDYSFKEGDFSARLEPTVSDLSAVLKALYPRSELKSLVYSSPLLAGWARMGDGEL